MADITAPANSNLFTWLTSLSPAVIALVSLLAGTLAGGRRVWVSGQAALYSNRAA